MRRRSRLPYVTRACTRACRGVLDAEVRTRLLTDAMTGTTNDRALASVVRSDTVGQSPRRFVGVDQCIDKQPASDGATNRAQ